MAYMIDENGNYKRTVRCSYCYENGHNQSTCPQRKKDLNSRIKEYEQVLAENNFTDDWKRTSAQRNLDHCRSQLDKINNRGKNRKCGFCGETGHTRRTCPHRKEQTRAKLGKTLNLRKKVAERMIDGGFGPGALIQVDDRMAMVSEIRLDDISPTHEVSKDSYFYGVQAVYYQYVVPVESAWGGSPRTHGSCYIPTDFMNINDIPEEEWYRNPNNNACTLLSPVNVSEDILLTEDNFGDKKKVEKWVIENIVDPK